VGAKRSEVPTGDPRSLLKEAPDGRHFARLHSNPQALVEDVGTFVGAGLRRDNAVIVVASPASSIRYLNHLVLKGIDPQKSLESGQLIVRDGDELLGRFLRDGMPRWADFHAALGPVIQAAQAGKWLKIRVYGEMANDLWRAGHTAAAIRLEVYWNELASLYQFALLCCYALGEQDEASYADAIKEIGQTHPDV